MQATSRFRAPSARGALAFGVLAVLLVLGAICAQPAQAQVTNVSVGDKTLGSVPIYQAGWDSAAALDGVSYDPATKVVTIDGAKVHSSTSSALTVTTDANDTVTLKLVGKSVLSASKSKVQVVNVVGSLVVEGTGSLVLKGDYGLCTQGGGITVKGGTVDASACTSFGISGDTGVRITGGKVSAAGKYYALYSPKGKISNGYAHLGTVKGLMGKGASFVSGGSRYQVTAYGSAELVQAKKTAKRLTVDTVRFGGYTYDTARIAARALSGCKATKVVIGYHVEHIDRQAFYQTAKLTTLDLRKCLLVSPAKGKVLGCDKRAFQKAGASGGKKLRVLSGQDSSRARAKYKKLLVKWGLSAKATVVR